jgi:hypothetical protein
MPKMSCAENFDYIKNRKSLLRAKMARPEERFRVGSEQTAVAQEGAKFRIGFRHARRSAFLNRNAC